MNEAEVLEPVKGSDVAPPPTLLRAVAHHLANWTEVYLWVPVSLIAIWAAGQLVYVLQGRKPAESADFLVDYAGKAVEVIAIIALTSVAKQALGTWMTKDDNLEHPYAYTVNALVTLTLFLAITFTFLH